MSKISNEPVCIAAAFTAAANVVSALSGATALKLGKSDEIRNQIRELARGILADMEGVASENRSRPDVILDEAYG